MSGIAEAQTKKKSLTTSSSLVNILQRKNSYNKFHGTAGWNQRFWTRQHIMGGTREALLLPQTYRERNVLLNISHLQISDP